MGWSFSCASQYSSTELLWSLWCLHRPQIQEVHPPGLWEVMPCFRSSAITVVVFSDTPRPPHERTHPHALPTTAVMLSHCAVWSWTKWTEVNEFTDCLAEVGQAQWADCKNMHALPVQPWSCNTRSQGVMPWQSNPQAIDTPVGVFQHSHRNKGRPLLTLLPILTEITNVWVKILLDVAPV